MEFETKFEPVVTSGIVFSDYVIRDQHTRKLTLVGIFQRFICSKLPFTAPAFFVTAFATNMRGRVEEMPATLKIENEEGRTLCTTSGRIYTKASIVARHNVAEIAFSVPSMEFRKIGVYHVKVSISREVIGQRTFQVRLI
jgi:hypothetical protein